jgi:DNA-binding transcriptional MocR family regulator
VSVLGSWRAGGPVHRCLADGLRLAILDGRLALDARLPGEREVAVVLGVSRTTVTTAFAQLRDEGFLASGERSASRTSLPHRRDDSLPSSMGPFPDDDPLIDMAGAAPNGLPGAVHRAMAAALISLPEHLPGHGYSDLGLLTLRTTLAQRYSRDGVPTGPGQIMVTSGALHALSLIMRACGRPGQRVIAEQPTYPHALDAIRAAGLRPVPLAMTRTGWNLDDLEHLMSSQSPALVYLICDYHNPTGLVMPAAARKRLGQLARRYDTVVVIDETNRDLCLDGTAPPPTPSGDHVLTIGSASKSYWGGLRIGWIRGPQSFIDRIAASRRSMDLGSPVVEQLAVHELLHDRLALTERMSMLRTQRDHLMRLIDTQLDGVAYAAPNGGLSLWIDVGAPVSSALAAAAPRYGVRLAAGPRFGVGGTLERHLRLPYTQRIEVLDAAIGRLAALFDDVGSKRPTRSTTTNDMVV